jgi:hypothetical protein
MRSIARSLLASAALATASLALATACSPAPSPVEKPLPPSALVELPPPASAPAEPPPLASAAAAPPCSPAPPPLPPPPTPPAPPDRAAIAAGLDAFLVGMVLSDRSDLTLRAAPFLVRGRIWDLEHFGHAHPYYAHIGELSGAPSVSLSSSEAFVAFAQKAGVRLDTEVARAAYVSRRPTFASSCRRIWRR